MKLSIVATLYQSARHLSEFHQRASEAARNLVGEDYEIVLVNDGSPDQSLDLARQLGEHDRHVVVIDLSRNFGHHKAMMCGLENAIGTEIFLIDSDLEEDPAWIKDFAEKKALEKSDVTYGIQEQRKGRPFERWSGHCFWRLFNLLTGMTLPANMVTARLMSRRYVEALLEHREREVFMAGLWHITGFHQSQCRVSKRSSSPSTYTFQRKVALLVNSVTSFSTAPLLYIFYFGIVISLFASIYISFLCIHWAFLEKPPSGWTSVMASIWLLGGLIMSSLGIVGVYLSKVFSETKQRPYTIVRQVYGRQKQC